MRNTSHRLRRVLAMLLLACVVAVLVYANTTRGSMWWLRLPWDTPSVVNEHVGQATPSAAVEPWDESMAPNYYVVVGQASFDVIPDKGSVVYAPLDSLGRATGVVACVDARVAEEGSSRPRQNLSDVNPSGWGHNDRAQIELPSGKMYRGYFWNRSHLLAKSLGGSDELENLVCGTRMQNVGANVQGSEGGMAYTEALARDWLAEHPEGNVLYAAKPCYVGNEPVCRSVVVDVLSSDGSINCEVVVFNAAKGYCIDYTDGGFVRE